LIKLAPMQSVELLGVAEVGEALDAVLG
jgi:hypothetical protein